MENSAVISSDEVLSFRFPTRTVERSNDGSSVVKFSCPKLSVDRAVVFGAGEDVKCVTAGLTVEA